MASYNPILESLTLPGQVGPSSDLRPTDRAVLNWIREAAELGEQINRSDPNYEKMDAAQEYVLGDQLGDEWKALQKYLPQININETKRSIRRHVSAITDIKPVFAFKTDNPNFQTHSLLVNQLVVAWWVNTFADRALGNAIKYAGAGGSGDIRVEYNPHLGPDGDIELIASDPRDTLPISPSRDGIIQNWRGVILKEAWPLPTVVGKYPQYRQLIIPDSEVGPLGISTVFTRFRRKMRGLIATHADPLAGLGTKAVTGVQKTDEVTLYKTYMRDNTVNTTAHPVLVGLPGSAWAYTVPPAGKLYPRGRLIISTPTVVLFDGPNPFWHGMHPVVRLQLDPWPWSHFGQPIVADTMPLSDAINRVSNDFLLAFEQWVNPRVSGDVNAIPRHMRNNFDPRKPGTKTWHNQILGEGLKIHDGPTLPPWGMDFLNFLVTKHNEQTGTANLDALLQLRQMPSDDTIEKFYEALTPEIRLEGREVELALRQIADMWIANCFQFYDMSKRTMIGGPQMQMTADFDFDPGNMIPAMAAGESGYIPQLDKDRPRDQRAQYFLKLFTFYVTPNSLIALNAQQEQMKYVQLARAGLIDIWTLLGKMEIPNVGEPPVMPLPPLQPQVAQQAVAQQMQDMAMSAMTGQPPQGAPSPYKLDPATGQIVEMRKPMTITERLMAQMQLGLGMQVNPAGRKASGQEPPKMESKDGGSRQTITESHK